MSYEIKELKSGIDYNGEMKKIDKQKAFLYGASILCAVYSFASLHPEMANETINNLLGTSQTYFEGINYGGAHLSSVLSAVSITRAITLGGCQNMMEKLMGKADSVSQKQNIKK